MSISITRCHTAGSITGIGAADIVGGLIGWLGDAQVEDCYSTMDIICNNGIVGGLIGWQDQADFGVTGDLVERCYAQGDIEGGADFLGGLIGWMANGVVSECFAEGDILGLGVGNVGGFCGWLDGGTLEDCYCRGDVDSADGVGGFCGYQWGGTMRRCYSTGLITCPGVFGGFLSDIFAGAVCTDCYFDFQTAGTVIDAVALPKTTAEMKASTIFAGWDFITIWAITPGCNE